MLSDRYLWIRSGLMMALMCGALVAWAQNEGQNEKQDTLKTKRDLKYRPTPHFGVFAEGQMDMGPTPFGQEPFGQVGGGVAYKRFSLGAFINNYNQGGEKLLIFPNTFSLLYAYVGMFGGYQVVKQKLLEAEVRLSYGHGDMIWERADTKEDFERDVYGFVKPELLVSFVPVRFVKLYAVGGYRKYYGLSLRDLDSHHIDSDDFTGFTYGIGLRIGYFNQ